MLYSYGSQPLRDGGFLFFFSAKATFPSDLFQLEANLQSHVLGHDVLGSQNMSRCTVINEYFNDELPHFSTLGERKC